MFLFKKHMMVLILSSFITRHIIKEVIITTVRSSKSKQRVDKQQL